MQRRKCAPDRTTRSVVLCGPRHHAPNTARAMPGRAVSEDVVHVVAYVSVIASRIALRACRAKPQHRAAERAARERRPSFTTFPLMPRVRQREGAVLPDTTAAPLEPTTSDVQTMPGGSARTSTSSRLRSGSTPQRRAVGDHTRGAPRARPPRAPRRCDPLRRIAKSGREKAQVSSPRSDVRRKSHFSVPPPDAVHRGGVDKASVPRRRTALAAHALGSSRARCRAQAARRQSRPDHADSSSRRRVSPRFGPCVSVRSGLRRTPPWSPMSRGRARGRSHGAVPRGGPLPPLEGRVAVGEQARAGHERTFRRGTVTVVPPDRPICA